MNIKHNKATENIFWFRDVYYLYIQLLLFVRSQLDRFGQNFTEGWGMRKE